MRLCSTSSQVTEESSCFWVSGHFTRCWSLTQSRTNSLLMSAPVFCHSWGQSAWVEVIKAGWGFTQSVFDALGVHTSAALAVFSLSMWGLGEMLIGFVWLCLPPGQRRLTRPSLSYPEQTSLFMRETTLDLNRQLWLWRFHGWHVFISFFFFLFLFFHQVQVGQSTSDPNTILFPKHPNLPCFLNTLTRLSSVV